MSQPAWTPPPVGYCLRRRADDPHLRDADLLAEITSMGYRGRLAAMADYLRNHGPARQRCTQCGSWADSAIAGHREMCLFVPGGQLPVPARPLAGEMLASYLGRLAAANHLPVATLMSALPAWLTWRFASHRVLPPGTRPAPEAAESLHRLAALTGTPAASIARTLPVFGGAPRGLARAITACRRCAAARGIAQPVPVHQSAHETVCTRHGIWLPLPGLPQLDITACPEIAIAQHRARALQRRCTPEQLIYAQVKAAELAASGLPGQDPSPGWEQRAQLLRKTNPGLNAPAGTELIRAARYPDIIALTAKVITTAARDPAPGKCTLSQTTSRAG
jgi:TniQ